MLTPVPLWLPLFTAVLVHGWYIFRAAEWSGRSADTVHWPTAYRRRRTQASLRRRVTLTPLARLRKCKHDVADCRDGWLERQLVVDQPLANHISDAMSERWFRFASPRC